MSSQGNIIDPWRTARLTGWVFLGSLASLLAPSNYPDRFPPAQATSGRPIIAPSAVGNVLAELYADGQFSHFSAAISLAQMNSMLSDGESITVFAPTDEAFARRSPGETLLEGRDRHRLRQMVSYHAIAEDLTSFDLQPGAAIEVETLAGVPLTIELSENGEEMSVNGAKVVIADIAAANGTIHAIDEVLEVEESTR